ncbi:uncharacterized protein [Lolium perenne]|uniref:uncharacterized protein n=1 Tax=Lolium perenne TaxID=4522 RepID=UPI003A99DD1E
MGALWGLQHRVEDKNNGNLDRRMVGRFRRFLNDCELKEIYLHGRRYTWSNERETPTLVRLDRVFVTVAWEELHCSCSLRCLATVVADHCPVLFDCTTLSAGWKRFQFERFWLRLDGFDEVVQSAWDVVHGDTDPFRRLTAKLKLTACRLMSWSDKKVGCIKLQLMIAREVVLRLDIAMESRLLTPDERRLRAHLKQAYLGLASLERTMARQRAKIAWLREGHANTAFFHQHAAYRRQKNVIHSLRADNAVVSDHAAMAEATFAHFEGLLGTSVARAHSLDLDLTSPSSRWHSQRRRADFMAAFDKLYTMCGHGFQGLNQALLVLLPKRPDAMALGDYRPISLIHIFAKLVAKNFGY